MRLYPSLITISINQVVKANKQTKNFIFPKKQHVDAARKKQKQDVQRQRLEAGHQQPLLRRPPDGNGHQHHVHRRNHLVSGLLGQQKCNFSTPQRTSSDTARGHLNAAKVDRKWNF